LTPPHKGEGTGTCRVSTIECPCRSRPGIETDAMANPLVFFAPSGKRGRFPEGTSVLEAARKLGVDLDSVCGGRGICGRCQVSLGEGKVPQLGITPSPAN